MFITATFVSLISSYYLLHMVIEFIIHNGNTAINYKGNKLYNSAGLFLSINIIFLCTSLQLVNLAFIHDKKINQYILALLIGVLSASFTGYVDDNSHDEKKGISRHIHALLTGEITAGNIKAIVGVITSFIICVTFAYKSYNFIINLFLICGGQNFINLMDLRPCRAIKTYIALSLIAILFTGVGSLFFYINWGVIISLLFYLPYELREICMLGDVGSNVIGILLGIIIVSVDNMHFRIAMLLFFITVQAYAEKKSISILISQNSFLNYIDMLGREKRTSDKNMQRNSQGDSK